MSGIGPIKDPMLSDPMRVLEASRSWHRVSAWEKVLGIAGMTCLIFGLLSMLTLAGIHAVATGQPTRPVGAFRHPELIKTDIRYLTDGQYALRSIAMPLMVGAFGSSLLLAAVLNFFNHRWACHRVDTMLDEFSREREKP